MNLAGTAFDEFERLINKEIKQKGASISTDISLLLVDLILDGNALETMQFLEQQNLSESLFYVTQLHHISKKAFHKIDLQALEKMMGNNASNKLAIIIWVAYKAAFYKEAGYTDIKLTEFYKEILEKYSYLVPLDDILHGTTIFGAKPLSFQWKLFIYESILLASIEKHPQNFTIHAYLIKLYYETEKYDQALNLANRVANTVKNPLTYPFEFDYHYIDFLEVLELRAAILHKKGASKSALKDCDFIIRHLPFKESEEEIRPFYELHLRTFLLRATLNLELQNKPELHHDIALILKYQSTNLCEKLSEFKPLQDYIFNSDGGNKIRIGGGA